MKKQAGSSQAEQDVNEKIFGNNMWSSLESLLIPWYSTKKEERDVIVAFNFSQWYRHHKGRRALCHCAVGANLTEYGKQSSVIYRKRHHLHPMLLS